MSELLPTLWTEADLVAHFDECPVVFEVRSFAEAQSRLICGCGEASRHTPQAVARAELDLLTTEVDE